MSEEIQKHITVKQICTDCQEVFYKQNVIVDLPLDFKISDIKKQLKPPPNHCTECNKKVEAKFSFYHEEKIKV